MPKRLRYAIGPVYLFLCLVLGGSAQGIWGNMALQLLGLVILAATVFFPSEQPLGDRGRQLLLLGVAGIAIVALQSIPLPPGLWRHLGGRQAIAQGYETLGLEVPWLPLSLTPYLTLNSLLGLIPPLAMFVAIVRLRAYRTLWLVLALLAGTIAGVMLGAVQVAGADYDSSPWYLYAQSNFGVAVGFFANANHMAILLVSSLPFLAALIASARGEDRQRNSAMVVGAAGAAVVVLVGIGLNRSLAAIGLTLPVMLASALIVLSRRNQWRRWVIAGSALLLLGAIFLLAGSSIGADVLTAGAETSVQSRHEMLVTTNQALREFMPWGTGLGSYRSVYHLYELPKVVTNTYVIHAHDDYAELLLELGLLGGVLIILFLVWWGLAAWQTWRSGQSGPFARAASIASAAILVHSLVDFPLRTAAISAAFAMCLGLLIERRSQPARTRADLRPTRHVEFR